MKSDARREILGVVEYTHKARDTSLVNRSRSSSVVAQALAPWIR